MREGRGWEGGEGMGGMGERGRAGGREGRGERDGRGRGERDGRGRGEGGGRGMGEGGGRGMGRFSGKKRHININFLVRLALGRHRGLSLFFQVEVLVTTLRPETLTYPGEMRVSTSTVVAVFSKMALTGQRIAMVDVVLLGFSSISISIVGLDGAQSFPLEMFFSCSLGAGCRYFSVPCLPNFIFLSNSSVETYRYRYRSVVISN